MAADGGVTHLIYYLCPEQLARKKGSKPRPGAEAIADAVWAVMQQQCIANDAGAPYLEARWARLGRWLVGGTLEP
jgi:hypothetical protein